MKCAISSNVVGRIHDQFGMLDVQRIGVFQKSLLVFRGVLLHRDAVARGIANDLVVHVGDVHDVLQLVAALLQEAAQHVDHDKGAEVADVPVVIHRGTAGIHADQVVFQRTKLLDLPRQGVE